MKGICFLLLTTLIFLTTNAPYAFAIGRRPKKETDSAYSVPQAPKKPIPPPSARDMQVSTGEIPPIDQYEGGEGKG